MNDEQGAGEVKERKMYAQYKKPSWAPPGWLFAPVWSVLYVLIAISFGAVAYAAATESLPLLVWLPFVLNLVANVAYTPIQFGLRNMRLATVDIFIVLGTLIWSIVAIHSYIPWVSWINIPYLLWVSFATILQCTVLTLNWK